MKTLADFKRALQIGTKWEGYNCYNQQSLGIREVSIRRSERFAFRIINSAGEVRDSWCDFPKAKDIKFREDGTVEIWQMWSNEYQLLLTYKQIKG